MILTNSQILRRRLTVFLGQLALFGFFTACPATPEIDAGFDASIPAFDAGRSIRITRELKYRTETGVVTRSGFSDAGVQLFSFASGSYVPLPLEQVGNAFTGSHLPSGDLYIKFRRSWYVTQASEVDLGRYFLGRPDVEQIDAGAVTLSLATAGLGTWSATDRLEFFSEGANAYGINTASNESAWRSGPATNASATSFGFDYGKLSAATSFPKIDSTKGDTLWALWMKETALIQTPVPSELEDGGTEIIQVPFLCSTAAAGAHQLGLNVIAPVTAAALNFSSTPTVMVGVTLPRDQWFALAPTAHATGEATLETLSIGPLPGGIKTGYPDLVTCQNAPLLDNPSGNINRSLTLANPFPSSWPVSSEYVVRLSSRNRIPDGGTYIARGYFGGIGLAGQPMLPRLEPVSELKIQGTSGNSISEVAASSQLEVTWAAPKKGTTPTVYQVAIENIVPKGGLFERQTIAFATTPNTSFAFPKDTLVVGLVYSISVTAIVVQHDVQKAPTSIFEEPSYLFMDAFTNAFLAR
jgi:hypothetical protein